MIALVPRCDPDPAPQPLSNCPDCDAELAVLRIIPGKAMMKWFSLERPKPTYGRLALIHCDGKPAIELLEVVAPEASARE